jgi:DNA primase
MVPIFDNGKFAGVLRRRTDGIDKAKYINNKGFRKRRVVGGHYRRGPILVVEGMFDLMKAWQFGFRNIATIFGWKASSRQIEKLRRVTDTVVNGLDNSVTGEEGGKVLEEHFKVLRIDFPDHRKDICEMNRYEFLRALPCKLN